MRTILFVISSLEYSGAARQLCLLAAGLPRDSFRIAVAVLGTETPWTASLRDAGVMVHVLGWRRPFDLAPFRALRRLVQAMRPDVVHIWGSTALRTVVLTGSRTMNRLLVSAALSFAQQMSRLDRWLLTHAEGIIAFGAAEAERYRRVGVAESRITVVSPAMPVAAGAVKPAELPGVAVSDRVLLGLGPIEQHKGFREAVWTFDILKHFYEDVHLVLIGDGPDRPRVEQFARQIGVRDQVHFVGNCVQTASYLYRSDLVWVPSLRGGVGAALEALAAGRPVIASRLPDLAEIVVDGATGYLVEPNDKAALARRTRQLLDDPPQRERMGEAGRQRVREQFPVDRLVTACAQRYVGNRGS